MPKIEHLELNFTTLHEENRDPTVLLKALENKENLNFLKIGSAPKRDKDK
jgi:hypothetical protein